MERRTLAELIARYELEPAISDIFTEGQFDYDVLNASSQIEGLSRTPIYPIDSVEIDSQLLMQHGLTEGNKQRLLVLARECYKSLSNKSSIKCIVDRDLDHWFAPLEDNPYIKWTPFCSIELMFFDKDVLFNLLVRCCRAKINLFPNFFGSLVSILRILYTYRLADMQFGWNMRWIAFDRCLTRQKDLVQLDREDYLKRLLCGNSKAKHLRQFRDLADEWERKLTCDCRQFIRGHDLVEALAWSVRAFSGIKEMANGTSIERLFIAIASNNKTIQLEIRESFFV